MSIVSSYFPGRIRLRGQIFKDPVLTKAAIEAVQGHEAIKNISWNEKTGSLLIEYDPEKLEVEKLKVLIPELRRFQTKVMFYNERHRDELLAQIDTLKARITGILA